MEQLVGDVGAHLGVVVGVDAVDHAVRGVVGDLEREVRVAVDAQQIVRALVAFAVEDGQQQGEVGAVDFGVAVAHGWAPFDRARRSRRAVVSSVVTVVTLVVSAAPCREHQTCSPRRAGTPRG
ncbi:MAG TPA: hypothetical protein VF484_04615 [Candidatus Limnocylindrales bacterium]